MTDSIDLTIITHDTSLAIARAEAPPAIHYLDRCLALLQSMKAGRNEDFSVQWEIYDYVLSRWPQDLCERVVRHAVIHCQWRPAPPELRDIAARLSSPVPEADHALREVRSLIAVRGVRAKPDPRNPNILLDGDPCFSHPVIGAAVDRAGGWRFLCEADDAKYRGGGFDGSFLAAYERAEESFRDKVKDAIDRGIRPPALFPAYVPFDEFASARVSHHQAPDPRTLAIAAAREQPLVAMPERVRQLLLNRQIAGVDLITALTAPMDPPRLSECSRESGNEFLRVSGNEFLRDLTTDTYNDNV